MADTTQANAVIRRATNQAHRAIDALDARNLTDLTRLYEEAASEIRARLAAAAGSDDRIGLQELRGVLSQVEAQLARLREIRNAMLNDALRESAQIGVAPFDPLTSDRLRVTHGALMRVADDAVRFVRSFVGNDGLQLSDRIWRVDRGARDAVQGAIERAIILGQSADEAARELLQRNQAPSQELLAKARTASSVAIGNQVDEALSGAAADAHRLFRTEINRAHGEAFMKAASDHPDVIGYRFLLSPAHPRPDICDLFSSQNLYGLGPGVYPSREATPWPAHPNTLSYIEAVFSDEVSDSDRAGKQSSMDAFKGLSNAQQQGILGAGKSDLFRRGKLGSGAIRSTLSAARRRAGGS